MIYVCFPRTVILKFIVYRPILLYPFSFTNYCTVGNNEKLVIKHRFGLKSLIEEYRYSITV